MRTIGRKRSHRSPPGDTVRACSYCGIPWYRSQLVRDASGNLACPDDQRGRDVVTLNEGNLAWYSSRRMPGERGMPADGTVPRKSTDVAPPVSWNAPSVAAPFVPKFNMLWGTQNFLDLSIRGWSLSQANNAHEFDAPAVTITVPDPGGGSPAYGISCFGFAPNGDMWIGYARVDSLIGVPYISKISASKLLVSGTVSPDFTFQLSGAGISHPAATILLTAAGDMWVSSIASTGAPSGLMFYPAASIASAGSPAPTIVIHQAGITNSMNDLWLDPSGRMWFCNGLQSKLNRLSASQLLTSSAAVVPAVVLSVTGAYTGVTMDTSGNLWAAGQGFFDMFDGSVIGVTSSPTPTRRLTVQNAGIAVKLRFDANGNIWGSTPKFWGGYAASDLTQSGRVNARCAFTAAGALTATRVLNFNPATFHG